MSQRTMKALNELSCALAEEAGTGDMAIVLPADTYNAVVPPPPDKSGLTEYVVHVQGGRIRILMEGHDC